MYTEKQIEEARRREEEAVINGAARNLPFLVYLYDCILPVAVRHFYSSDGTRQSAHFCLEKPFITALPEVVFRGAQLLSRERNPGFRFDTPEAMVKAVETAKKPPVPPVSSLNYHVEGNPNLARVLTDRIAQPAIPVPARPASAQPAAAIAQPVLPATVKPGEVVLDQNTYDKLRSDAANFQLVKESGRKTTSSATIHPQAPTAVKRFTSNDVRDAAKLLISLSKLTYAPITFVDSKITWRFKSELVVQRLTSSQLEAKLDIRITKSIWKELGYDLPSSFSPGVHSWLVLEVGKDQWAVFPFEVLTLCSRFGLLKSDSNTSYMNELVIELDSEYTIPANI